MATSGEVISTLVWVIWGFGAGRDLAEEHDDLDVIYNYRSDIYYGIRLNEDDRELRMISGTPKIINKERKAGYNLKNDFKQQQFTGPVGKDGAYSPLNLGRPSRDINRKNSALRRSDLYRIPWIVDDSAVFAKLRSAQ